MSKPTAQRRRRKGPSRPRAETRDRSIYLGLLIIGAALVGATFLIGTGGEYVGPVALGYCAAMVWLANRYAWAAYCGERLAGWKQALARIPLRFAGYGTRGGKPLEAAHDAPTARRALLVSAGVSVVIVAGLAVLLIPALRP